jgi:hypothetical protein
VVPIARSFSAAAARSSVGNARTNSVPRRHTSSQPASPKKPSAASVHTARSCRACVEVSAGSASASISAVTVSRPPSVPVPSTWNTVARRASRALAAASASVSATPSTATRSATSAGASQYASTSDTSPCGAAPASSCRAWWRTRPCSSKSPNVTRRSLISTNASNAAVRRSSRCSMDPRTFDSSACSRRCDDRADASEALTAETSSSRPRMRLPCL